MGSRNTGKPSEQIFADHFEKKGKQAYVNRIRDASDLHGLNGKVTRAFKTGFDFLVTDQGHTFKAEVKSTENPTRFPFSLIKPHQWAEARRTVCAGGDYHVFVHRLSSDVWFRVPAQFLLDLKDAGTSSVPWTDMESLRWKM